MIRRTMRTKAATGFSLLELIMTIIILGLSLLVLVPFFTSITRSPDPMIRQQAVALGQALMDEILAKKWDQNTPLGGGPLNTTESSRVAANGPVSNAIGLDGEATTDRTGWNDVDDYAYINFGGGAFENGNFIDQAGVAFTLPGFKRWVEVDYIASNSATITATVPASAGKFLAGATDSKRIVVTVETPKGERFVFVAVVCNI
ncbi:MAG: hypothetical protein A2521_05450 [Deltaproteobacteria bacterium RIFOXYD12_FULL_57_12]|nr:MAG: hypothetical protein A2521_05450 [Deltaproteobacteria bacterium RIFOXYD12_FULL_57_12]